MPSAGADALPNFADVTVFSGVSLDVIRHFFDDDFLMVVKVFENFTCFLLLLMLLLVVVDGLWLHFTSFS